MPDKRNEMKFLPPWRSDFQAEVDRANAVRQCADRDEIDARLGHVRDPFQRHVSGGLGGHAATHQFDGERMEGLSLGKGVEQSLKVLGSHNRIISSLVIPVTIGMTPVTLHRHPDLLLEPMSR